MRRSAITNLNLVDIDFDRRILSVVEKGGSVQPYTISRQGVAAVSDYLEQERAGDHENCNKWQAHALLLSILCNPHGGGRLTARPVPSAPRTVRTGPYTAPHGTRIH